MADGVSFSRPTALELEAAQTFLTQVAGAEMVKFATNGSDVTTAAVKLARAATGRRLVAICSTQPFFATDDWFIGSTPMNAVESMALGVPPIASAHGAFPEIITSGRDGLLVPPGDPATLVAALAHVAENPDERPVAVGSAGPPTRSASRRRSVCSASWSVTSSPSSTR